MNSHPVLRPCYAVPSEIETAFLSHGDVFIPVAANLPWAVHLPFKNSLSLSPSVTYRHFPHTAAPVFLVSTCYRKAGSWSGAGDLVARHPAH
jgi:hypothetical protein